MRRESDIVDVRGFEVDEDVRCSKRYVVVFEYFEYSEIKRNSRAAFCLVMMWRIAFLVLA